MFNPFKDPRLARRLLTNACALILGAVLGTVGFAHADASAPNGNPAKYSTNAYYALEQAYLTAAGGFKATLVNEDGTPAVNPSPVLTQTAGASVTCGVASGALIAAGSSARWVRFENIDAAGDGFHFAIGGAAATTGQLVPAGGVVWRYTAAAVNCIRTAAADSTVSVQEITQ